MNKLYLSLVLWSCVFAGLAKATNPEDFTGITLQATTFLGYHYYSSLDDGYYKSYGAPISYGLEFKARARLWWGLGIYYTADRFYLNKSPNLTQAADLIFTKELQVLEGKLSFGYLVFATEKFEINTYAGARGGRYLNPDYVFGPYKPTPKPPNSPIRPERTEYTFDASLFAAHIGTSVSYNFSKQWFAALSIERFLRDADRHGNNETLTGFFATGLTIGYNFK